MHQAIKRGVEVKVLLIYNPDIIYEWWPLAMNPLNQGERYQIFFGQEVWLPRSLIDSDSKNTKFWPNTPLLVTELT